MKKYNSSPLPFQGQKRRFIKDFRVALKEFSSTAVYVDLFGGSGLLCQAVKETHPNARVVWNDFDDYAKRLSQIEETNELIARFRKITQDASRDKKLTESLRLEILGVVRAHEHIYGQADYITISSSVLFSGKYAKDYEDLSKQTMYNCVRKNDYQADGYLQGVERVQDDYRKVFEQFKDCPDVVFLVDPPYLSTDTKSYTDTEYWRLRDYLDILGMLQGVRYFYFTSNKSEVIELCEWVSSVSGRFENPFDGANVNTTKGTVNFNSSYTDIMVWK